MNAAERPVEAWIGVGLVALAGAGLVIALAGEASSTVPVAWGGAAVLGLALTALVAAGWIDGPRLVVLAIPLPAVYESAGLRVAAAAPVTAAVVGAWLLSLGVSGRRASAGRIPAGAIAALLAVFTLATVTAQYRLTAVRETLNFALLLAFLFAATDAFADRRRLEAALDTVIAVAAACGVLAVLEMVRILPGEFPRFDTAFNRAALGFGQPNGLGLFLAMSVPFAVHRWIGGRDAVARGLAGLATVCIAAGLVATFSRGSWLAVLAGSGALLFTGNVRPVVRIWLAVLALAVVADLATGGMIRDTAQRTIGDWVIEQRAALMFAGVLMFLAYPLTGVGPGGYAESLDRFGPLIPQLWDYLPTPHNAYVQMAAEAGILGVAALVAFLGVTLLAQVRRTRRHDTDPAATAAERSLNRALLWSFATACAAGMVVWPFAHGTGQAMMLVAAAIFARPRPRALRTRAAP